MPGKESEALVSSGRPLHQAGDTFRNNIAGAVSTATLRQYLISAWSFATEPTNDDTSPYNNGVTFNMNITHTQGGRATYIKRTGGAAITIDNGSAVPGFDAVITAQNTVANETGSTISVQCTSPYNPAATPHGAAWFDPAVYNAPWEPGADTDPGGEAAADIYYVFYLTGNVASGNAVQVDFTLHYIPDTGLFNDVLSRNMPLWMYDRGETSDDWDVEWHSNNSYTNLLQTGIEYYAGQTTPGGSLSTAYWRAKRVTSGIWTNSGSVSWTDPRT